MISKPFEGDPNLARYFGQLLEQFTPDVIIETGTQYGATTQFFSQYAPTFTCEVEAEYPPADVRENPSIVCVHGDSAAMIRNLLHLIQPDVPQNIFFYLDAHVAPEQTALMRELHEICAAQVGKKHLCIIAIHDFLVPGAPSLGYDEYHNHGPLCLDLVASEMDNIFNLIQGTRRWVCRYNHEEPGAFRGVGVFGIPTMFAFGGAK